MFRALWFFNAFRLSKVCCDHDVENQAICVIQAQYLEVLEKWCR